MPTTGRDIYLARCFWCHGEDGRGNGLSAAGMLPKPRDFVEAHYRIRSTPFRQLPTDEDLFRAIAEGMPGTPMPGWKTILSEDEITRLVDYVKDFSPRFGREEIEPLSVPDLTASVQRGEQLYTQARCFMCHGDEGRGDGGITTALDYQWGVPHRARDFTRGWTFKGGHDPREIYLRITGGLNGTPMGPFRDLLSDQDRWDLAHYVASLDEEPSEIIADFVVVSSLIDGEIPLDADAEPWTRAAPIVLPLGGQVVLNPTLRWWTPTAASATVRSLRNEREIGFLVEWNDPTPPRRGFTDAAMLQFASHPGGKPYLLRGDPDNPVRIWRWQSAGEPEQWAATGIGRLQSLAAAGQTSSVWETGRWRVVFRQPVAAEPDFAVGGFVPILLTIQDGANDEVATAGAISTWLFVTTGRAGSARPWLTGLAYFLACCIAEVWILGRLRS